MPEKIIRQFQKEYGDKLGKKRYYQTANKQGRDPETFKKKAPKEAPHSVKTHQQIPKAHPG